MTDAAFRVALGTIILGSAALAARLGFVHDDDLPPIPPMPEAPRAEVETARATAAIDRDPATYASHLADDSTTFGVEPIATPADLSAVMEHRSQPGRVVLEPGRKHARAEVLGLALTLSVEDIPGSPRRQLVLTVENTTSDPVAYRVVTQSSRGLGPCHAKSDIAHNAIALLPGEKARRSECIYRKGLKLFVDRVETVQLPRLSYYYVSALPPAAFGVAAPDRLAGRGHRPAKSRSPCRVYPSAELLTALSSGETTWRDLVDFYARHPCRHYNFPIDYKAFEKDGETSLPAVPPAP